jgi:hypothetical protein
MPYDPAALRLGRRPARADGRTLRFAKYLPAKLPAPPASCDYGDEVKHWGMLANDRLGDCTAAGILHQIMLWGSRNGVPRTFSDEDAVALYSALCGYVPGRPETDRGGVEIDILKAWRRAPIHGCELIAFASVNPRNWAHVKLAHWLSGSLYMGVNLPLSAQSERVWRSTLDAPGGWGGHCLVTSAYADKGCWLANGTYLEAVTWGATQKMTPKWLARYCDELWVPITDDWFGANGRAPNGYDLAQLKADVEAISLTPTP